MSADTKKALKICALTVGVGAWLCFIFSNSLKNSIQSADQSEAAEGFLRRILLSLGISGNAEAIAEIAVRKAAHVFEFFVLALLIMVLINALSKSIYGALGVGIGLSLACACADELLQTVSHRGASVKDVLIDAVGIILGALLYLLCKKTKKT